MMYKFVFKEEYQVCTSIETYPLHFLSERCFHRTLEMTTILCKSEIATISNPNTDFRFNACMIPQSNSCTNTYYIFHALQD